MPALPGSPLRCTLGPCPWNEIFTLASTFAAKWNGENTNSAFTLTDASSEIPLPPACNRASPPTCTVFDVTAKNPLTVMLAFPCCPRSSAIGCSFGKSFGG